MAELSEVKSMVIAQNISNKIHKYSAYLVASLLLAATSCGYMKSAIGPDSLVIVVASDEDRVLLEPTLESVFDYVFATPSPERLFQLKWVHPVDFDDYRHYKNLVVASLANPADSSGDILARRILGVERIKAAAEGGNPIFTTVDYTARGQMFMGIIAHDAVHARAELTRLKSWIFARFEEQVRTRQSAIVYRYKDEEDLAQELSDLYDFNLRIQYDYIRVKEKPEQNFVWLGKGNPFRWLAVNWIDNGDTIKLSQEFCWERMDYIADSLFESIYIDTLFRTSEPAFENDHEILILRGAWGHKERVAGGPFVTYVYRDKAQNRVYFVTGVIFHPGRLKSMLLKRLEVIIRTMHTFDEPPSANFSGRDSIT